MNGGLSIKNQEIGISKYKQMLMATIKDAIEIIGYGNAENIQPKISDTEEKTKEIEGVAQYLFTDT